MKPIAKIILVLIVFYLAGFWQSDEIGLVDYCEFANPGGIGGLHICKKMDVSPGTLVINYEARRSGLDPNRVAYVFVRYGNDYAQARVSSAIWTSGTITVDIPPGVDSVLVGLRWLNKPPSTGGTVYLRNVLPRHLR